MMENQQQMIEKLQQDMATTSDAAKQITRKTSERAMSLHQVEAQLQIRKAELDEIEAENSRRLQSVRERELELDSRAQSFAAVKAGHAGRVAWSTPA